MASRFYGRIRALAAYAGISLGLTPIILFSSEFLNSTTAYASDETTQEVPSETEPVNEESTTESASSEVVQEESTVDDTQSSETEDPPAEATAEESAATSSDEATSPPPAPEPSYAGTMSARVGEWRTLSLTAPEGMVFTDIVWASYGNSTNFEEYGTCHATNTTSVLEPLLGGNTFVVNPAGSTEGGMNAIFGDPCGGTGKTLGVVVAYSADPNAEPPAEQNLTEPELEAYRQQMQDGLDLWHLELIELGISPSEEHTQLPEFEVSNNFFYVVTDYLNAVVEGAASEVQTAVDNFLNSLPAFTKAIYNYENSTEPEDSGAEPEAPTESPTEPEQPTESETQEPAPTTPEESPSPNPAPEPTPEPEPSVPTEPEPTPTTPEPTPEPELEPSLEEIEPEPQPEPTPEPSPPVLEQPQENLVESPQPSAEPEASPTVVSQPKQPREPAPPVVQPELPEEFPQENNTTQVENLVEQLAEKGQVTAQEGELLVDAARADGIVTREEVAAIVAALSIDGELSQEDRAVVVSAILEEALQTGGVVDSEAVKSSGLDYSDLPPETPVDVRTDAEGNAVVISAEVADNLEVFSSGEKLVATLLSDPAKVLSAIADIGLDMSEEERRESEQVVVAAVVVANIAQTAAAAARALGGGAPGGGSSSKRNSPSGRRKN